MILLQSYTFFLEQICFSLFISIIICFCRKNLLNLRQIINEIGRVLIKYVRDIHGRGLTMLVMEVHVKEVCHKLSYAH